VRFSLIQALVLPSVSPAVKPTERMNKETLNISVREFQKLHLDPIHKLYPASFCIRSLTISSPIGEYHTLFIPEREPVHSGGTPISEEDYYACT
jgi:hypothetical protein